MVPTVQCLPHYIYKVKTIIQSRTPLVPLYSVHAWRVVCDHDPAAAMTRHHQHRSWAHVEEQTHVLGWQFWIQATVLKTRGSSEDTRQFWRHVCVLKSRDSSEATCVFWSHVCGGGLCKCRHSLVCLPAQCASCPVKGCAWLPPSLTTSSPSRYRHVSDIWQCLVQRYLQCYKKMASSALSL